MLIGRVLPAPKTLMVEEHTRDCLPWRSGAGAVGGAFKHLAETGSRQVPMC
jgi:hypothetical protein